MIEIIIRGEVAAGEVEDLARLVLRRRPSSGEAAEYRAVAWAGGREAVFTLVHRPAGERTLSLASAAAAEAARILG